MEAVTDTWGGECQSLNSAFPIHTILIVLTSPNVGEIFKCLWEEAKHFGCHDFTADLCL